MSRLSTNGRQTNGKQHGLTIPPPAIEEPKPVGRGRGRPPTKTDVASLLEVRIPELDLKRITIVVGAREGSTLILHKWSEKAKRQIRDRGQRVPRVRVARDPKADFLAAKYLDEKGRDCIRADAFKSAMVYAARFSAGELPMTVLKGAFFVLGELLPLKFKKCLNREDFPPLPSGGTEPRYRPEYHDWSVALPIEYNANVISPAQILNLLNLAGFHVGVAEWRPCSKKSTGTHGRFEVQRPSEVRP